MNRWINSSRATSPLFSKSMMSFIISSVAISPEVKFVIGCPCFQKLGSRILIHVLIFLTSASSCFILPEPSSTFFGWFSLLFSCFGVHVGQEPDGEF